MTIIEASNNVSFAGWDPEASEWSGVTHVVYRADPDDTQVGWGSNADPRGVLTPGSVYELERVKVHSWHTKVFLKGIDCGRGFNSVSFDTMPGTSSECCDHSGADEHGCWDCYNTGHVHAADVPCSNQ